MGLGLRDVTSISETQMEKKMEPDMDWDYTGFRADAGVIDLERVW